MRSGERKDLHVGASLQQVLLHVVPEVVQQLHLRRRRGEERRWRGVDEERRRGGDELHLLLDGGGELVEGVVVLGLLVVDVMDVEAVGEQQQLRQVVEHDADRVVVERVAEAVLVAVVDPLRQDLFTYL